MKEGEVGECRDWLEVPRCGWMPSNNEESIPEGLGGWGEKILSNTKQTIAHSIRTSCHTHLATPTTHCILMQHIIIAKQKGMA